MGLPIEKLMKVMPGLLKASGMALDFREVAVSPESVEPLAAAASLPGAKMLFIQGRMKDGSVLTGVLVANVPDSSEVNVLEKMHGAS